MLRLLLRVYKPKGFDIGHTVARTNTYFSTISSNAATSLMVDGSDANFAKQLSFFKEAVDSAPLDAIRKEKI